MVGVNTIPDLGNEATPSPSVGDANVPASLRTMTDAAPANQSGTTRSQLAKRGGIGWLMAVLVFSCIALVPFVVAAIVLLGH